MCLWRVTCMRNLAIIPARSGSKGLPDKNIKLLNGVPLLAYSIKAAQESGMFDKIMVSTDSKKYADIAIQYGASVPFLRSKELSGDSAGSWDVAIEVLKCYQETGHRFDTVCLLQPTSPLRTADDIVGGYALLEAKNADAVTSVCEVEHSPLWCMTLEEDLSLSRFVFREDQRTRQQLPVYYRLNGALYIRKISYNEENINIYCQNEFAFIMPRERSIDIDTKFDLELAEVFIHK